MHNQQKLRILQAVPSAGREERKTVMIEDEVMDEMNKLNSILLSNCTEDCDNCSVSKECERYAYLCQLLEN